MIITTNDKIKEIERELKMRKDVFPRLVLQGKISQSIVDKRIKIMEEILKDYREKAKQEDKQMSLL
jgi:hypothetical protein